VLFRHVRRGSAKRIPHRISCDGVNAKVMDNLLANLPSVGPRHLSLGCRRTKTLPTLLLRLTTCSSEEDVWEACFVVDPANLRIDADHHPAQMQALIACNSEKPEAGASHQTALWFFQGACCACRVPAAAVPNAQHCRGGSGVRALSRKACNRQPDVAVARRAQDNDKVAVAPQRNLLDPRQHRKSDQLINLVGELVITQAMLAQTASQVDR